MVPTIVSIVSTVGALNSEGSNGANGGFALACSWRQQLSLSNGAITSILVELDYKKKENIGQYTY